MTDGDQTGKYETYGNVIHLNEALEQSLWILS